MAVAKDDVGGGERVAHFGSGVWTGVVVALCGMCLGVNRGAAWQDEKLLDLLRRLFSFSGAVCTIGLTLNLEDDGFFHDAIEESHSERAIGEIVPPFLKIHVRSECGGFSLVSQVDDFIK